MISSSPQALANITNAVDAEIEFVGHHLEAVQLEFAERWDELTKNLKRRIIAL